MKGSRFRTHVGSNRDGVFQRSLLPCPVSSPSPIRTGASDRLGFSSSSVPAVAFDSKDAFPCEGCAETFLGLQARGREFSRRNGIPRARIGSGLAKNRSMNPTGGQELHPSHKGERTDGVRSRCLSNHGIPRHHSMRSFRHSAIESSGICDGWDDFLVSDGFEASRSLLRLQTDECMSGTRNHSLLRLEDFQVV